MQAAGCLLLCASAAGLLTLGLAHAPAAVSYLPMYEVDETSSTVGMPTEVSLEDNTVHYHMNRSERFEDAETLEDFNVGFAATRLVNQGACYVRRTVGTIQTETDYLVSHNYTVQQIELELQLFAQPISDLRSLVGDRLTEFCGDLEAFKLVRPSLPETAVSKRQVTISFVRCFLFFFFPFCTTVSVTLPTNTNIIFIIFGK